MATKKKNGKPEAPPAQSNPFAPRKKSETAAAVEAPQEAPPAPQKPESQLTPRERLARHSVK